jgi:hypothetical protein
MTNTIIAIAFTIVAVWLNGWLCGIAYGRRMERKDKDEHGD